MDDLWIFCYLYKKISPYDMIETFGVKTLNIGQNYFHNRMISPNRNFPVMFELKLFYTPIFLFGFYLYGYDIIRHSLVRNWSWIIGLMSVMLLFETHHKNEAILFNWVQSDPCIIQRVFILILLTKFKRSYRTLMIYSTFCAFLRNSLFF